MGLLRRALSQIGVNSAEKTEPELNRDLYREIVRASHDAAKRGEEPPVVVPEGRNPPVGSDREQTIREFKIPDFYWAYIDHMTEDPSMAARQFVVECKRLTERSANWIFTREYVRSGIARFISNSHGYGKETPSGAMVGYLQCISLDEALREVNDIARLDSIPTLNIQARDNEVSADLDHDIVRTFPESPFHLTHVWVRVTT